jgi:hypothetical protein
MDDSWPASPRAEELSDSISSHAVEVERTLRALEAVEAFRAEAAALRAELHAARAPAARPPARRAVVAPGLSASTWRLIIEAGFLVAVAVVTWALELSRLEIILVMAGAWLLVAVIEAIAWRRTEGAYAPAALPPESPVEIPAAPEPVPSHTLVDPAWPGSASEPEPAELTTVLPLPAVADPDPEPEPEPEPVADAAPETDAPSEEDLEVALAPRKRRLPRLRRRRGSDSYPESSETSGPTSNGS